MDRLNCEFLLQNSCTQDGPRTVSHGLGKLIFMSNIHNKYAKNNNSFFLRIKYTINKTAFALFNNLVHGFLGRFTSTIILGINRSCLTFDDNSGTC